jgi:hypothetical protein
MAPTVIEVDAEQKDMLDDMVRALTVFGVAWLVHAFVFKTPGADPFDAAIKTAIVTLIGIGAYHLVVKSLLLKFVVKRNQEQFYATLTRET